MRLLNESWTFMATCGAQKGVAYEIETQNYTFVFAYGFIAMRTRRGSVWAEKFEFHKIRLNSSLGKYFSMNDSL